MKITSEVLNSIIIESVNAILREGVGGNYMEELADSVSVAMVDEYGFSDDSAYDIAFDTIDAHSNELTGDKEEDFNVMLNTAIQGYVNEAVLNKRVIKEDVGDFTEYNPEPTKTTVITNPTNDLESCCSYIIHEIEETFKKDHINNVDREIIKKLIVDIYDKLTETMGY